MRNIMERIQSVNLDRIEWACAEYGMTLEQLSPIAGVSESAVKHLTTGDGITPHNLQNIAGFLGHGVLFFVEQGPVETDSIYTPQFRTILNRKPHLSKKLRKFVQRVEKQRETYIALQEAISEPGVSFTPPDMASPANGPQLARDWLNLSTSNNFGISRKKVEEKGVLRGGLVCLNSAARFDKWNRAAVR